MLPVVCFELRNGWTETLRQKCVSSFWNSKYSSRLSGLPVEIINKTP